MALKQVCKLQKLLYHSTLEPLVNLFSPLIQWIRFCIKHLHNTETWDRNSVLNSYALFCKTKLSFITFVYSVWGGGGERGFLHHMGQGDQAQVIRLGNKCLGPCPTGLNTFLYLKCLKCLSRIVPESLLINFTCLKIILLKFTHYRNPAVSWLHGLC